MFRGLRVLSGLALFGGVLMLTIEGGIAVALLIIVPAAIAVLLIHRFCPDRSFLVRLFIWALIVRIVVGTIIYVFEWQSFFGGDAYTYDLFGNYLLHSWDGDKFSQMMVSLFTSNYGSGWGMLYLVAGIYKVTGQNMLAIQYTNALAGAATAVVSYLMVVEIFGNRRVARVAALSSAFFPSMVLWSSQGLKDGPIIFLLAVCMLATLKLGGRFSAKYVVILVAALLSLLTLSV